MGNGIPCLQQRNTLIFIVINMTSIFTNGFDKTEHTNII